MLAGLLVVMSAADSLAQEAPAPRTPEPAAKSGFVEKSGCGLDFVHRRFTTPTKKYLPETAGSGVGLFDYDGDGLLDVYCVQCCPLPGYPGNDPAPPDELYHNDGQLRFHRVADVVKVKRADGTVADAPLGLGDRNYGMGVTCPDVDNDGDPDLLVTNVGRDALYRNNGDGTFTDVTKESGVVDDLWSAAAGWADLDGDGDLDLYLGNYALIDFANYKVCGTKEKIGYCHPDTLASAPDRLFRNDGGFHFTEITKAAGIVEPGKGGKALAVVPFDYDDDGRTDLYVANDADPNFVWHNLGGMKFEEVAGELGVAVDGKGRSQSCMGSDIADVDGDLRFDILSANFGKEGTVLYVRGDGDFYDDRSASSGLLDPSYLLTGFGARLFDYDRDADVDLMVVNGHISDNVHDLDPSQTFEQVPQFFENRGDGTFVEVGRKVSPFFEKPNLGRGLAVGDLDNDGDEDAIVLENDHAMVVLEDVRADANHWIAFELKGSKSPRDAIGARVLLTCGDKKQVAEIRGSASFLSWQDLRLHFGVGERKGPASATIRWPSGRVQELKDLALDRCHRIEEPK
jgi:enediyne biosynthesis protein E4